MSRWMDAPTHEHAQMNIHQSDAVVTIDHHKQAQQK